MQRTSPALLFYFGIISELLGKSFLYSLFVIMSSGLYILWPSFAVRLILMTQDFQVLVLCIIGI